MLDIIHSHKFMFTSYAECIVIQRVYYGGIDGHNLDDCLAAVDLSKEVCNMYIHNNRQKAYDAFVLSVLKYKQEIRKDSNVEVAPTETT